MDDWDANASRVLPTPTLITPGWPPRAFANGVVTYVGHLSRAMSDLGVKPHIIAAERENSGADALRSGRIHAAPPRRPPLWRRALSRVSPRTRAMRLWLDQQGEAFAAVAAQVTEESRVDIIEMEESFGWPLKVMSRVDVPVVVRLHGPWFLNGPAQNLEPDDLAAWRVTQEGLAIAGAHGLTAPSRDVLDRVREHYRLELPDAAVIANPTPVSPPHQRWDPQRAESGRILFIGRFDRHKGGDVMLDAFARLAQRRSDALLVFAGLDRGLEVSRGRFWTLERYLEDRFEPQLRSRVHTLGQCSAEELDEQRRRAAVTVVPSRYESFGLTLTEAMSLGCPVVATSAGALSEIVQDGRNGLLAQPEDAADLARAVEAMLCNVDLAARLGAAAVADCIARYSPRSIALQTLAYYQQVAARRRPRIFEDPRSPQILVPARSAAG